MSVIFETLDRLENKSGDAPTNFVPEGWPIEPGYRTSKFERVAKAAASGPGILNRLSGLALIWKPRRLLDIRFGPQAPPPAAPQAPTFDSALLWATTRLASRARA